MRGGDCLNQKIKSRYITGAAVLLISSVIVKVISAFYKIPLTAYIGAEGRGYFSVAYNLCLPIHALTMGAFPVALTKLISTADAKGDTKGIYALKAASSKLFGLVGFAGMAVMLIAAKPYSVLISSSPESIYTILALAPSVFFSCLCACRRAYAEGFLDMKLTAASQLIEAFSKMVFGLLFARVSLGLFCNEYAVYGTVLGSYAHSESEALAHIYPFTSAFAMLGATFGSVLAYAFSLVYNRINYKVPKVGRGDVSLASRELMSFSLTLVGATAVQSLANFFDTSSVQYCLSLCDETALKEVYSYSGTDIHTYVLGIFATALDFRNLVPSIVMALGVAAVPAVSSAYENGSESFSNLISSIFKYSTVFSCLGGTVLMLFGDEILTVLFSKSNPDIAENASRILFWFGATVVPSGVATTVVYCAQSLGFADKSIPSFIVGAAVRVLINFLLIPKSGIDILGSTASVFFGFLVIVIWNILIITKYTNVKIGLFSTFVKPVFCAVITYLSVFFIKSHNIFTINLYIDLMIYTTISLTIFVSLLFFTKCMTLKDFIHKIL